MQTTEFELVLDAPAYVKIATADGSKTASIDVYAARRVLAKAEQAASESERWQIVGEYIADKLKCESEEVTENVAIGFNNYVCAIIAALDEERKKKEQHIASTFATTVCSPSPTPASPATSAPGRPKKSKRGSKTSPV